VDIKILKSPPNISVIIRNRNEGEYIGFTLQSLCDHIPNAEVVIIDNNSNDDSLDVVTLFNTRLNILVANIDNYTPGRSLNKAIRLCTNDVILILSAHSQILKMDLEYVQNKLKYYSAVFGNQTPIYRGKKITKRYIWSHFRTNEDIDNMHSTIEDRPFLHNAFCFYNKSDLIETPFDETLSGKEDRYWASDILKLGKSYLYTPSIEVNHYYTSNGATWKGIG
jgi:glycosyltransferase involved in cell wall biosynthesis